MNTVFAILIAFGALTLGLMAVAAVMLAMGIAGGPGGLLFEVAKKKEVVVLKVTGVLLAALGQAYVVGAYAVFVVALLRQLAEARPEMPTWPLWIAAVFHSGAAPAYGLKELQIRPESLGAHHYSLGMVALWGEVALILAAFAPRSIAFAYSWVPFFTGLGAGG